MTEAEIEKEFVQTVEREFHFPCLKLRIDGRDGFPDRTVITPQGCFFVEFKTQTGQLRPQQRQWLKRLRDLNQTCVVARSAAEAVDALFDWLTGADPA